MLFLFHPVIGGWLRIQSSSLGRGYFPGFGVKAIIASLQASPAGKNGGGLKTLRRAMRCRPGIGPLEGESPEIVCPRPGKWGG